MQISFLRPSAGIAKVLSFVLAGCVAITPALAADLKYSSYSDCPTTLVVYFHGLTSNGMEPFTPVGNQGCVAEALLKSWSSCAVVSFSNDAHEVLTAQQKYVFVSEKIEQCLKLHSSVRRIVLCGTSLGGYEALSYLSFAPELVLERLAGVISVEPPCELCSWYEKTADAQVRSSLESAFGGNPYERPAQYRQNSLSRRLSASRHLPRGTRIIVVSASKDKVVPREQQDRLRFILWGTRAKSKFVEFTGSHGIATPAVYALSLQYIMSHRRNSQRSALAAAI